MAKKTDKIQQTNETDAIYIRLQENIRLLLARYDMQPCELAKLMNISKRTLQEYRKYPGRLKLGQVDLIAKILRTDMTTLMYGDVCPAVHFARN